MHFMIWRLYLNLTVYHQYPTLAILAHKHLGIDALLELERTKLLVFIQGTTPQNTEYASESQSVDVGGGYTQNRFLFFVEGTFHQKTQLPFPLLTLE